MQLAASSGKWIDLTCLRQLDLSLKDFPHAWQENVVPSTSIMRSDGPEKDVNAKYNYLSHDIFVVNNYDSSFE